MGAASASSAGASQHKALVFSAWSHLRKEKKKKRQKGEHSWEGGREGEWSPLLQYKAFIIIVLFFSQLKIP